MANKFLYETEDMELFVGDDAPNKEEMEQADDGYLQIINLEDMTYYFRGEWIKIKKWDHGQ